MRYAVLQSKLEIKQLIDEMKRDYRNLSKILVPESVESTIKGSRILTIYRNLDPVMKIEADNDELLGVFIRELDSAKKAYSK